MTLKSKFEIAVNSLREAMKAALDDPNFDDSKLSEVWRHYLGMQSIWKSLPEDSTSTFSLLNYGDIVSGIDDYQYPYTFAGAPSDDQLIFSSKGTDSITFS